MSRKPNRNYSIVFSFVLHVLLLTFWALAVQFDLFGKIESSDNKQDSQIVFEIQPDRDVPREIVETPEDARADKPPQDAQLLSDKNARARNPEVDPNLKVGEAFSRGMMDSKELPTNSTKAGERGVLSDFPNLKPDLELDEAARKQGERSDVLADYSSEFKREYLIQPKTVTNPGESESVPKVRHDNQDSRALDLGGFSLNTYEWDFAPYVLGVKKKVEPNIFPPPAFYKMGLISGETWLRFKIMPSGELQDLQVIKYEGHKTLMQTSIQAIEISAPFAPLPRDFPEPYLEITARFTYFINK